VAGLLWPALELAATVGFFMNERSLSRSYRSVVLVEFLDLHNHSSTFLIALWP
jgi:hypothetical protein